MAAALFLGLLCLRLPGLFAGAVAPRRAAEYPLGHIPLDKAFFLRYFQEFPQAIKAALPASYDARTLGIVAPAKDQGLCGSCWAFACVGALESHIKRTWPKTPLHDLSEQQLLSCNTYDFGCHGGNSSALHFWERQGPNLEADYPYASGSGAVPACIPDYPQLGYCTTNFSTTSGTENFKASLFVHGPGPWSFTVHKDFQDWWDSAGAGSVYTNVSYDFRGGHEVVLIGWDDGKGAFLCQNSWGAASGPNNDGTFWIAYAGHANDLNFSMSNFAVVDIDHVPSITVISPNGGESWAVGSNQTIAWSSTGAIAAVTIDYSQDSGISWTPIAAETDNDGSLLWDVTAAPSSACLLRVADAHGDALDTCDAPFTITISTAETISLPHTPSGPTLGSAGVGYAYSTGGSCSSLGHAVQYLFDWDDGSDSGWLDAGMTQAAHSWSAAGTYNVRAKARCAAHATIESLWSATLPVIIYDGNVTGAYNSPAWYKVLPEVIWAPALGGGTWQSAVQVTDVTGGSRVSVYYNTGKVRRGPFLLWDNSAGEALSSVKYANLLETIDGLDTADPEAFTYFGTVGTVEFITQDGSHAIQAAARTQNGHGAKTFTALSLHDANTAATGRAMVVSNLTSNAIYRSTAGFFNPTSDSVTVEFTLLDGSGGQIGMQFSRTLAGHEFLAFNPFNQAGASYPTYSYDNVMLRVRPTTGTGKVMCYGATVENAAIDPAAHVAVQEAPGFDNSPSSLQILPEVIWASAMGGGTWKSSVQVIDVTGGSKVSVYYDTATGRRGPFLLWDNSAGAALSSLKLDNLLQAIDGIDSEAFTYYGTVGAVEFVTQDGSRLLQVAERTLNGSYSKTFPGLNLVDAETADTGHAMLIQNFTNNAVCQSTCGFFNPTSESLTLEFTLLDGSGGLIVTQFSKTLAGHEFLAFNPFSHAGVPYPAFSYDNIILRVRPTSGNGKVMCFGASVDNTSNDPASHLAVQGE